MRLSILRPQSYHGSNRPCGVKECVYLYMIEAVRPGNDIYSDTLAKAILSRDKSRACGAPKFGNRHNVQPPLTYRPLRGK
jgi:hypothetical protein